VAPAELYVGLARERVVAILDTVTDRVIQRISLASLGRQGHLSQIGVAPSGNAAVLPISGVTTDVGLVSPRESVGPTQPTSTKGTLRQRLLFPRRPPLPRPGSDAVCTRVSLPAPDAAEVAMTPMAGTVGARQLVADSRGRAYIVVGDGIGAGPAAVAIVDMASGGVLRHLPLTEPGERAGSLAVLPDGSRVFAAVYAGAWPVSGVARRPREGRIVAIDTQDGRVSASVALPEGTGAVTSLSIAAPPASGAAAPPSTTSVAGGASSGTSSVAGGAGQALYVTLGSPLPSWLDQDALDAPTHPTLLALGVEWLETLDLWLLDHPASALAVLPDGRRAYALMSPVVDGPWSRELLSLDLASGASRHWPIASGTFSLALSPVGKLYVADTLGDRLWRLDTRTDSLLAPLYLSGAPLALGARPA
jgi:DNA-binding beta-propeller fold protein YncE